MMDPVNSLTLYKCHPPVGDVNTGTVNSNQFMSLYSIDVRHDSYISTTNQCEDCRKSLRLLNEKSQLCQKSLCLKGVEKGITGNKGCWTVLRRKFGVISRIIFSRPMNDLEEAEECKSAVSK